MDQKGWGRPARGDSISDWLLTALTGCKALSGVGEGVKGEVQGVAKG